MISFEGMLTGGHPNSLGQTEDVVASVLADPARLGELYDGYFSMDETVRLRVASAMKRVAIAQPDLAMSIIDRLLHEVAAIDQASVQWTLALIFDGLRDRLSDAQHRRALEIMQHNVTTHDDWIVLCNSIEVLAGWAEDEAAIGQWLRPHVERLLGDPRKTVRRKAQQVLDRLDR